MKPSLWRCGAIAGILLAGCSQTQEKGTPVSCEAGQNLGFLTSLKNAFPPHFSIEQLRKMVAQGELKEASTYVNGALKLSVDNFALHLVNGFVYEEMMRHGMAGSDNEMALMAYRSAHNLEPNHWLTAYLLGNWQLRNKSYAEAQKNLADAALLRPGDGDIAYALACASYYMRDLPVASSSIAKAIALDGSRPFVHRSACMIFAACGQFSKAEQSLNTYKSLVQKSSLNDDSQSVSNRLADWRRTHQQARLQKAAVIDSDEGQNDSASETDLMQKPIVVLSVFIVDMRTGSVTQKGNNILSPNGSNNVLSVVLNGSAQYGRNFGRTTRTGSPTSNPLKGSWSQEYRLGVSQAALNYSAQIANVGETILQYVARPVVSTLVGEKTILTESDQVMGTPQGGSQITIDAGVRVVCTPLSIAPDGKITLEVLISGVSFSGNPATNQGLTNQLISTKKAQVSTTVQVYPGQTFVVAGTRADERFNTDSGFPFLRFIPFIQYAFANVDTKSSARNILYMVSVQLGGKSPNLKKQCLTKPSAVARRLNQGGFQALGEYSTLYYILKYLEKSPMFAEFQSGDLVPPFWGYGNSSLSSQLEKLKAFLYF
jgi:general secretion pathway protein D